MQPLGEWALMFFNTAASEKSTILYSPLTIMELGRDYPPEDIVRILRVAEPCAESVKICDSQRREAQRIAKERHVPVGDVLHAILARDNDATMVTRDRHFLMLKDIVPPHKPEEL